MCTHRLTLSEANPDVALEPYVVAARELEGVEARLQALRVRIVVPLAEYSRIRGTTVLIGDQILILHHIFHGLRDAASREAAINRSRLYLHLQHKAVADFSGVNLFTRRGDNSHDARRWWTRIGNSSSRR